MAIVRYVGIAIIAIITVVLAALASIIVAALLLEILINSNLRARRYFVVTCGRCGNRLRTKWKSGYRPCSHCGDQTRYRDAHPLGSEIYCSMMVRAFIAMAQMFWIVLASVLVLGPVLLLKELFTWAIERYR